MKPRLKKRTIGLGVLALAVLAVLAFEIKNYIRDRDIPSDMPRAVRKEVRKLRSPWTQARWKALVALRGMGEKAAPAAPFVLRMYPMEKDRFLRNEALDTLAAMGEPAIEPLCAAVQESDYDIRGPAITALGRMGKPAVEPLINVLKNHDGWVQARAAEALGRIGDPRAVEPLMAFLMEPAVWTLRRQEAERAAVNALGAIGDPRAIPALIPWVRWSNKGPQEEAGKVLLKMGTPSIAPLIEVVKEIGMSPAEHLLPQFGEPALRAMLEALHEDDHRVRERVGNGLIRFEHAALPPLIAALGDEDWRFRSGAARALRNLQYTGLVPTDRLIAALKDERAEVRWEAAATLGATKGLLDPGVKSALAEALRDENAAVRWLAALALTKSLRIAMSSPRLTPGTAAEARDFDEKAQWLVSVALGEAEAGSTEKTDVPTEIAPEIRVQAVKQLGAMGKPAAEALTGALQDNDPTVRGDALRQLCAMDAPEVADALIAVMRDNSSAMKRIAQSFVRTRNTRAVPALIAILEDRSIDALLRCSAAWALGEINDPRAVGPLIEQSDDPHADLRRAISDALRNIRKQNLDENFEENIGRWREREQTVPDAGAVKEDSADPESGKPGP